MPRAGAAMASTATPLHASKTAGASATRTDASFKGSCRDVSTDSAGNLRASCQKVNGRWERAYLAERSCPSHRAGNSDGRLVCEQ